MQPFYSLSNSAGMIRSNKFTDQADAVCVGTYRAEALQLPVKIFEHKEPGDGVCILICNPDGSVAATQGAGMKTADLGNESSGVDNKSGAFMLLSAYDEMPITTFYLKSELSEAAAQGFEKDLGIEVGLYDSKTLHAYTEDAGKIRALETKLAEASVEVDRVRDSKIKREKLEAGLELVESARKAHKEARAARMPEMAVRASLRTGSGLKLNCHCEMVSAAAGKSPRIRVYADGQVIGEVKSDREAARVMADYAERAFAKFLKKELA